MPFPLPFLLPFALLWAFIMVFARKDSATSRTMAVKIVALFFAVRFALIALFFVLRFGPKMAARGSADWLDTALPLLASSAFPWDAVIVFGLAAFYLLIWKIVGTPHKTTALIWGSVCGLFLLIELCFGLAGYGAEAPPVEMTGQAPGAAESGD